MVQSHISHGKLFVSKTNRFVCHILVTSMFTYAISLQTKFFSHLWQIIRKTVDYNMSRCYSFLSDIEFRYFFIELRLWCKILISFFFFKFMSYENGRRQFIAWFTSLGAFVGNAAVRVNFSRVCMRLCVACSCRLRKMFCFPLFLE